MNGNIPPPGGACVVWEVVVVFQRTVVEGSRHQDHEGHCQQQQLKFLRPPSPFNAKTKTHGAVNHCRIPCETSEVDGKNAGAFPPLLLLLSLLLQEDAEENLEGSIYLLLLFYAEKNLEEEGVRGILI